MLKEFAHIDILFLAQCRPAHPLEERIVRASTKPLPGSISYTHDQCFKRDAPPEIK